jgi:hypothetical protein
MAEPWIPGPEPYSSRWKGCLLAGLVVAGSVAVAFVGAAAVGIAIVIHQLSNLDLEFDRLPPRDLPHRPPQPAEVCLPLAAVHLAAAETWRTTQPVLDAGAARPDVARRRVRTELTTFSRALERAEQVAPRNVRPHLERAHVAVRRGRRDAAAKSSFETWRTQTWSNAFAGYVALLDAGWALGDACKIDLAPPYPLPPTSSGVLGRT